MSVQKPGGVMNEHDAVDATTSSSFAPTVYKRGVLMNITGSPATFDSLGASAGTWSMQPATAAQVFGPDSSMSTEAALKVLSRAVVHSVTMKNAKTNVPDVCALNLKGLKGNVFTHTGEDAHVFLLGPGDIPNEQVIYRADGNPVEAAKWLRRFPGYTAENFQTKNTMKLQDADYWFVHERHPITELIYNNRDALGTEFPTGRVNEEWLCVNNQLFEDSCHTLKNQTFANMPPTYDLGKLEVHLRRPNNLAWLKPPATIDAINNTANDPQRRKQAYKEYAQNQLYVFANMEIEYSLPDYHPDLMNDPFTGPEHPRTAASSVAFTPQ